MANGMFWSTFNGDGVGKQTGSVKMPLSPLVACSFYFYRITDKPSYLSIPVSYFALTVQKQKPCIPCLIG